jgi:hypothetical protein
LSVAKKTQGTGRARAPTISPTPFATADEVIE